MCVYARACVRACVRVRVCATVVSWVKLRRLDVLGLFQVNVKKKNLFPIGQAMVLTLGVDVPEEEAVLQPSADAAHWVGVRVFV